VVEEAAKDGEQSSVVTLIGNLVRVVIFDTVAALVFLVVGIYVLEGTVLGAWLVARRSVGRLLNWRITMAIVSGLLVAWWMLSR
jgi:hypothetical protein